MTEDLILASASPRRRELLTRLGWRFSVEISRIIERAIDGERPADMVCRLASEKALDVFSRNRGKWIIGADTIVVSDGLVLGKPKDSDEAVRMLSLLSGKKHTVVTGVALVAPSGEISVYAEKTDVFFRKLSENEAVKYVTQGESFDKAGAYAIQGRGSLLIERIDGCYFNVVGLPLRLLSSMFEEMGVSLAEQLN